MARHVKRASSVFCLILEIISRFQEVLHAKLQLLEAVLSRCLLRAPRRVPWDSWKRGPEADKWIYLVPFPPERLILLQSYIFWFQSILLLDMLWNQQLGGRLACPLVLKKKKKRRRRKLNSSGELETQECIFMALELESFSSSQKN